MQNTGMTTIDLLIAIVYVFGIIGIGVYFSKKHKSPKDFLLAGRSMGWLPVGLSLMATLTSAVGYMSFPAGAFKGGLILLWMAMAIPLSFPVVVYVFMPFYHKLGEIPRVKHTTFYKPDGKSLFREELVSSKGFSG